MGSSLQTISAGDNATEISQKLWAQDCILHVKLTGHDTGGVFALLEIALLPGANTPLRVHTEEDLLLYVLEGEIEARLQEQRFALKAGECLHLPRNAAHSYRAAGNAPARSLITVTPAGLELYFQELARLLTAGPAEENDIVSISAEYGIRFISSALP